MPELNDIDKKKHETVQSLAEYLTDMSNEAYRIVLEEIEKQFDFKEGKFIVAEDFVDRLNKVTASIMRRLQLSPKFNGPVSQFVKRFPEISKEISKFQLAKNKVQVPAFEAAKKAVIDETMQAFLDRGLNANFVQPLRDLVYRNATSGLSLSQSRSEIKEYIKGGNDKSGKLKSYIEQTSLQSVDAYSGAINKKLMETFDYNAQIVTGTIIDNSAPQCIYAVQDLKGIIKKTDWPKVKDKATKKAPLIDGTTFENLPIMQLHWGCRHSFYPIILQ